MRIWLDVCIVKMTVPLCPSVILSYEHAVGHSYLLDPHLIYIVTLHSVLEPHLIRASHCVCFFRLFFDSRIVLVGFLRSFRKFFMFAPSFDNSSNHRILMNHIAPFYFSCHKCSTPQNMYSFWYSHTSLFKMLFNNWCCCFQSLNFTLEHYVDKPSEDTKLTEYNGEDCVCGIEQIKYTGFIRFLLPPQTHDYHKIRLLIFVWSFTQSRDIIQLACYIPIESMAIFDAKWHVRSESPIRTVSHRKL